MTRGLSLFLLFHAVATFAAGAFLVIAPGAIPSTVGIKLEPQANLVVYLLAGSEFGFAVLSYLARSISDRRSLHVIVITCVVLHGSTAGLELLAFARGIGAAILGNVFFRLSVIAIFLCFDRGLRADDSAES